MCLDLGFLFSFFNGDVLYQHKYTYIWDKQTVWKECICILVGVL